MLTYITIRHRTVTVLLGYENAWQRPSRVLGLNSQTVQLAPLIEEVLGAARQLAEQMVLQIITLMGSSPSNSTNLPRPASAIPIAYMKVHWKNCAGICSETDASRGL